LNENLVCGLYFVTDIGEQKRDLEILTFEDFLFQITLNRIRRRWACR
jgi:hypothetical protein